MKVLIIAKKLTGGGAERVATNLATCLSKHVDTELAVINGDHNTYGSTVKTIDLHMPDDKGKLKFLWHYKVYKKIKEIKRKDEITHSISFMAEADLSNVLSRGKEKVLISVRNKHSSSCPTRFHFMKNRWVFNRADRLVSLSKMVKVDLVESFGVDAKKIFPIYNPCYYNDIEKKCAEDIMNGQEKDFFAKNHGKVVITAGRLEKQKGQWHLIRAFKRVHDKVPDAKLVILGQGTEENYLESLITELELQNSVFLYGFKANPYAYMAKADVFAFSSLFEGLGNILVECMACKLPIVSVDCPYGPKELLAPDKDFRSFITTMEYAEYGILVPPMDGVKYKAEDTLTQSERVFADALVEILIDADLRLKYKKLITERGKDFLPDKITNQWLEVLKSC